MSPSLRGQKIRWLLGASVWPRAVSMSITRLPLSKDVTKSEITTTVAIAAETVAAGNASDRAKKA